MPYGGKFLIRRSVRIIPAHKKHRQQAGVLLARRSTPTYRNLSAARLSDILPGSYLLAEQSPGSSQLQTPPGVQHPSRAYSYIIKEKSPCVKGIFSILPTKFSLIFCSFRPSRHRVHRAHEQRHIVVVENHKQERAVQLHLHSGRHFHHG